MGAGGKLYYSEGEHQWISLSKMAILKPREREKQTVNRSDKGFLFELGGSKSCIWRNVPQCN